jgi:integrase
MAGTEKSNLGKLEAFLECYNNTATRNGYSVTIYAFMDSVYGNQRKGSRVKAEEKDTYSRLVDQYLSETRDYREDLMKFAMTLQSKAPLTTQKMFIRIVEFLSVNDIEVKKQDLKRIRSKLPKGGARTIERDMDTDTIRSILQHLDVKGKALVLVLASSGMRISEALSVTLEDIDWKHKPVSIQIHGENTKTGENRIKFISTEAAQAVEEWLKVRDGYLKAARNKNNGFVKNGLAKPRNADDRRLFPFTDQTASQMWDNALKNAGFFSQDKTTNRKQLHFHMFRKFFLSQISLVISKEIPEVLAGHAGYLTDAYRRYTKKQLAEEYLKAEYVVTIQTPKEIHEIESEFKSKMETHSEILESLVKKNIRLDDEVKHLTDIVNKQNIDYNKMVLLWADLAESAARRQNDQEALAIIEKARRDYAVPI